MRNVGGFQLQGNNTVPQAILLESNECSILAEGSRANESIPSIKLPNQPQKQKKVAAKSGFNFINEVENTLERTYSPRTGTFRHKSSIKTRAEQTNKIGSPSRSSVASPQSWSKDNNGFPPSQV